MRIMAMIVAAALMTLPVNGNECSEGSGEVLSLEAWEAELLDADGYSLSIEIESLSEQAFRMIDARTFFIDALGRPIISLALDPDLTLAAGERYTLHWNRIVSADGPRLATIKSNDVQTKVCVYSVVYDDGVVASF